MSRKAIEYGARHTDGSVSYPHPSVTAAEDAIKRLGFPSSEDDYNVVARAVSPWGPVDERVIDIVGKDLLPLIECSHCRGTNLGFECDVKHGRPGDSASRARVEFFQACNDCSETLWVGDWDLFHSVLAFIYDIKVPRCD